MPLLSKTAEDLEERRVALEADVGKSDPFHLQRGQQPDGSRIPAHVMLLIYFRRS